MMLFFFFFGGGETFRAYWTAVYEYEIWCTVEYAIFFIFLRVKYWL